MNDTATAHLAWDRAWGTEAGRADWLEPDPDIHEGMRYALRRGARKALDLGCGVGRHALALAQAGFEVSAIDASETGVAHLREEAARQGLAIDARTGYMTDLPYADESFHYVVAFNVIYHGDGEIVRHAIAEIDRVLVPGGIYQGTMLSKENVRFGQGREIAPDTFVLDGEEDKAHPHFYCDHAGLLDLFEDFTIARLSHLLHRNPGSWHWHLLALKRDAA